MGKIPNGYNAFKTIRKGLEPPLVVILVANMLHTLATKNGIDVKFETVIQIVLAGYGAVKMFINWIKNKNNKPI